MRMFSFLRKPKLAPEAKAALLVYLKEESEVSKFWGEAAVEHARAIAEALEEALAETNDMPLGPAEWATVKQKGARATARYIETLNSAVTRHSSIDVPLEATDHFLAHETLYKSLVRKYEAQLEAQLVDDSTASYITQAKENAASAAQKAYTRHCKEAVKAIGRLHRTLGISRPGECHSCRRGILRKETDDDGVSVVCSECRYVLKADEEREWLDWESPELES